MNNAPAKSSSASQAFAFIPAALDDYGLTAPQFRIFCRISRRGRCTESVPHMALACRVSENTAWAVISALCSMGLIKKTPRHGETSILEVNPPAQWKQPTPNNRAPNSLGRPIVCGATHRNQTGYHPPQSIGHKGSPSEGNPIKEGSVGFNLDGLVGGLVKRVSVRIANAPSLEAVKAEMESQFKGASQYAESFHRKKTEDGWRDQNGQPINHWKPMARSWASACEKRKRGVTQR